MTLRVSCPYCNTGMNLPSPPSTGRVNCPRCGESFSLDRADVSESFTPGPEPSSNGTAHTPATGSTTRSHWPIALLALLTLLVVVGGGLYAILRKPKKANVDTPTPTSEKKISTFPPAVIPTLRYLPADSNIVFAAQFGPLKEYAEREKTDVKSLLLKAGLTEQLLNALTQKGINFDELEMLSGSLAIVGDALFPRLMLVLRFREEPSDKATLLKNMKATQFSAKSGATRYKVELGLPGELQILDGKVYLFSNNEADLDSAVKREAGSNHLPNGVRESMKQLSPASLGWLVTDSEDWAKKPIIKLAAGLVKQDDLSARLKDFRAAAISVYLEPNLNLAISLRGPDELGGEKLSEKLAASMAGKSDQVQFSGSAAWAKIEWPLGGTAPAISFRELLPPAK